MSVISKTYENYASDWWTPPEWMLWVRQTLLRTKSDQKVFDPCPGNWTPPMEDGLKIQWEPFCYVNHPGSRGSAKFWWEKSCRERERLETFPFIWCSFNVETLLKTLNPNPMQLKGYLVCPINKRTKFIWGGSDKLLRNGKIRKHGTLASSPGNYTVWWTNMYPAEPPIPCRIHKTLGTYF